MRPKDGCKNIRGEESHFSSDVCMHLAYELSSLHRMDSQPVALSIFKMRYEPVLADALFGLQRAARRFIHF